MRRVPVVRISTELPIAAETAFELAQKPELFKFVVAPILRVPRLKLPDRLEPGTEGSARLWWLGVVPCGRTTSGSYTWVRTRSTPTSTVGQSIPGITG